MSRLINPKPFIVFSIDELEDDAKQISYQGWMRLYFPMGIDPHGGHVECGAKIGSFEHYLSVCRINDFEFFKHGVRYRGDE